ncbi:MAG: gamma-glutamyltransferase [Bacteroidota bacterium]
MKPSKLLYAILLSLGATSALAQGPIFSTRDVHHPILGQNGMVATQHPEATRVGLEVLRAGGNAIDAAVAVGFSLAVVLPRAGNLGGGGFMLVHDAQSQQTQAINYREMAPRRSTRDMYLDEKGEVDREQINASYRAVGVPGTVAGLALALEEYGSLSLAEVLQPAIQLAERGFPISHDLAQLLRRYEDRLRSWPHTAAIFYPGAEQFYEAGDTLRQPDLAWSLRQIATAGPAAFYRGAIAQKLRDDMRANDGLVDLADLKAYRAELLEPQWGTYRGYRIASMPPPSSGGIHLIQLLNILEAFPLGYLEHNSAETIHLMVEAMKLAYADRSAHLGDPNFWEVPATGLTSKAYAERLRSRIDRLQTRPSEQIAPGRPQDYESEETTHYSVADAQGNVVSNTYTLNFSFGTGIVAAGTGILLNNEMSDFSAKPGVPNDYGLLGGEANAVAAGKRPLSSMTPTLVLKDGRVLLATGSPGGSRIITTVLQILLNVIDHGMNIAEASHAPRIHHQWYPDVLFYERGIGYDTRVLLRQRNHHLRERNAMGSTQSILLRDGWLYGASDPRRPDGTTRGF